MTCCVFPICYAGGRCSQTRAIVEAEDGTKAEHAAPSSRVGERRGQGSGWQHSAYAGITPHASPVAPPPTVPSI